MALGGYLGPVFGPMLWRLVKKNEPAEGRLVKKKQVAEGRLVKKDQHFFGGDGAKMALKMSFFITLSAKRLFNDFYTIYAFKTAFISKKSRF